MRTGWVIVGVVLLILGFVLWYIPMNVSDGSLDVPAGSVDAVEANPPLALLTPNLPYTVTWSSDSGHSVNVTVYNCGTDSSCANIASSNKVTSGSGASGTVKWTGAKGNYYAIEPSSSSTVTVNVGEPLIGGIVGLALVAIGVIFLIVGAARKSKPRAPPQEVEPAEAPPEST